MPAVSARKGRRTKNEINMVPFIDVMLVLLIIFMVTAPMLTPSQIDLPSVGQADRQPDRFVQVIVDKDAALKVKDGSSNQSAASVGLAELVERVRELQGPAEPGKGTTPVVISADKNVKYETVVQVMDKLQRAGIQRVGLSVQQQP
ncbi:biopolymer transporter ExbD [Malikia sp.]|uniref:biopolymer transporter ExbD n=1 Tax=Malikia sp. TaxID=2070706 RepID=UPI002639FC0E|nr:biopolymer transporter ExbD [Malikia sp.]MDD2728093.1 biopolymer transporter ExbD [Malikia sp.]